MVLNTKVSNGTLAIIASYNHGVVHGLLHFLFSLQKYNRPQDRRSDERGGYCRYL